MKRGARRGRVSLRARDAARVPSRRARPRPAPGGGGTLANERWDSACASAEYAFQCVVAARGVGPGAAPETETLGVKRRLHCSFVRRRPALWAARPRRSGHGAAASRGEPQAALHGWGSGSAGRLFIPATTGSDLLH